MSKEASPIYSGLVKKVSSDIPHPSQNPEFAEGEQNMHFAMLCNGYTVKGGRWEYDAELTKPLEASFAAQDVTFFGPNPKELFFKGQDVGAHHLTDALRQPEVIQMLKKYRERDEDQSARLAFLLGGFVRHYVKTKDPTQARKDEIQKAVAYTAKMSTFGEKESVDAIAPAIAMYVLSGGSTNMDNSFVGKTYHMGESIKQTSFPIKDTNDLGLSQIARLRHFIGNKTELPDISDALAAFQGFPTVGAEFHLPINDATKSTDFLQRLAMLNMSQQQDGSFIQFARKDHRVMEIRMNPAVYPIAVVNWNHMRLVVPELNNAYFFTTLNRAGAMENFNWQNEYDAALVPQLQALGLLIYSDVFDKIPKQSRRAQVDFGNIYLGQTVRVKDGKYTYNGEWFGDKGKFGQLSIYTGFGPNFPHQSYYLSMALADPSILRGMAPEFLARINSLEAAFAVNPKVKQKVFQELQTIVDHKTHLKRAFDAGYTIMDSLNP